MTVLWISLPAFWDLQDVQAALNVVVTVLSAFCVFVFARVCWQTATARVVKNRNVPLAGLLSVNTVGEVFDVCRLLGLELLSSYYLRILAQCIVVTGLTCVAFASGPIVRFSTRWGTKMLYREVPGLMANRLQSGIAYESVLWNNTWDSLDQAGFPYDQLLDYGPNTTSHWKYVESQWNSTWHMKCEYTEQTFIALTVVETPCNENTSINDQIPALESIFPENALNKDENGRPYSSAEGYKNDTDNRWSELLMFRTGFAFLRSDNASTIWEDIDVTLVSLHMQGVPGTPYNETFCAYSPGAVDSAMYTKAYCKLRKTRPTAPGKYYVDIAFPDNDSLDYLTKAYTSFFQEPITVITPQNLTRFYQVYQITQDTQVKRPNRRLMNVQLEVVRLSTIFLVVCAASTLLCILGIMRYGVFTLRHWKAVDRTPQSKLDWMLQSIEKSQAGSPLIPQTSPYQNQQGRRSSRHSVVSMRSPDLGSPTVGRRRSDFETATYGSSPGPSTPYHMSWLSRQTSAGGGYFPLQEHPEEHRLESETSLLTKYPTAPAGPLNHPGGSGAFGSDYYIHR